MTPLCEMIEAARATCGIQITPDLTLPTGSFIAHHSLLIGKSPKAAVHLYNIAKGYCKCSGAVLHPDKRVAIPATAHTTNRY